jgi:hypothetical protein
MIRPVTAAVRWAEDRPARSVLVEEIAQLWGDIEAEAVRPVITVFHLAGAELHAVIGEATGTVLGYFPAGYEQSGINSLHSVGDRKGANRNQWQSPLVAYYLGDYSKFPRYSVVSHEDGRQALAEFLARPHEPPASIVWGKD